MIPAVKPQNESSRLEALRSYQILDSLPEKEYDDIVKLASEICGVPISLISLVDENRCWFKAKIGLATTEAPREIAYASHAINDPHEPMIVEDALQDERFFDCPLVLNDPPMRFYVGTPLVTTDNHALGTLCVIDTQPRKLSSTQISTLRTLAKHIVARFEQKKQLAEIKNLNRRLESAYKEMEAFSYTVSHDLRAPLRSIKGFSEIIKEDYAEILPSDGKDCLRRICDSTDKMNHLIEDMLRLSKVSKSKLSGSKLNFSVVCQAVINSFPLTDKYNIEIQENITVHADPGLAHIVAQNLVENAVKYSAKKDTPQVFIGEILRNGKKYLTIKDNGAGFNQEYAKEDIYRPFNRMHTNKEFKGSGIGLAIVKKIIDRHMGEIEYESAINEGTTFYFRFS